MCPRLYDSWGPALAAGEGRLLDDLAGSLRRFLAPSLLPELAPPCNRGVGSIKPLRTGLGHQLHHPGVLAIELDVEDPPLPQPVAKMMGQRLPATAVDDEELQVTM